MKPLEELLERYQRGPALVATAVENASNEELDFEPGPSRWSIRQLVCHLADTELVFSVRYRLILAQNEPALTGFDQDAWANRLAYSSRDLLGALENLRHLRAANYELLAGLPEEAFARVGQHAERGRVTLLDMVRLGADHVDKHRRHILHLRQQFAETSRKA